MNNFNFKNPPHTNPEQSKRLLDLGLDRNTADFYCTVIESGFTKSRIVPEGFEFDGDDIPLWSIGRLLEMIPHRLKIKGDTITDTVPDEDFTGETLMDSIIDMIEFQIGEDYFCEDYISSKKIKIVKDLAFYEIPQVFLAEDEVRNYYIGLAQLDFTYLIIKIVSQKPIKELLNGTTDLRELFEDSKYYYKSNYSGLRLTDDDFFTITKIDSSLITGDMLPEKGFFI